MKLTIKNKISSQTHSRQSSQNQKKQSFQYGMCCSEEMKEPVRKKFIHEKYKAESNLIKMDLYSSYSRIIPKQKISLETLHMFIIEVVEDTKFPYSRALGFLCCHVHYHYQNYIQRLSMISSILQTHKPLFLKKNSKVNQELKNSVLEETVFRIEDYCSANEKIVSQMDLQSLASMYTETLLLEFIPVDYSQFILKLYAKSPYEEMIRIIVSLAHYVLNTKNITSPSHAYQIMKNAYMGVVEWPIVITNRFSFVKQEWSSVYSMSQNQEQQRIV